MEQALDQTVLINNGQTFFLEIYQYRCMYKDSQNILPGFSWLISVMIPLSSPQTFS